MLIDTGDFEEVISITSREPRVGEIDGVNYYFKTPGECEIIEENGGFAEHIEFSGCHYGITHAELERIGSVGKIPVVIVEPNGLRQLSNTLKGICAIYIDNPKDVLYHRFLSRFAGEVVASLPKDGSLEKLLNPYSKRASSINQEYLEWPMAWTKAVATAGISHKYFHSFTKENEKEVLELILKILKT